MKEDKVLSCINKITNESFSNLMEIKEAFKNPDGYSEEFQSLWNIIQILREENLNDK